MKSLHVGLFFGSFNPIHKGHTSIAQYIIQNQLVDWVWFIVSPHNPFKNPNELASFEHRFQMVKIAVKQLPYTIVSNIEILLPRPSYTINTLNYLSHIYPDIQFSLILGMDNLNYLEKWRHWQIILDKHKIFIYPRYKIDNIVSHTNIVIIKDAPLFNISSTDIRNRIKQKKEVSKFLDQTICRYILSNNLYV